MVFKPGQSGNTIGKPRETKNKLSRNFIHALATSFEIKGVKVIDRVIEEHPVDYLRIIASVLPKELEITNSIEGLTDEQLSEIIAALQTGLANGSVIEAPSGTEREEAPIH